jgi:hypothetical protein
MMGMQSDCRWPHMGPWQACIGTANDLTWAHGGHAVSLPMTSHRPMCYDSTDCIARLELVREQGLRLLDVICWI